MCGGPEFIAPEVAGTAKGASDVVEASIAAEDASAGAAMTANAAGATDVTAAMTAAEKASFAASAAAGGAAGAAAGGAGEGGAGGAKATGGFLETAKTVAPLLGATASLVGAGASMAQAQAAKNAQVGNATGSTLQVATPPGEQSPIDADLTAIRKKNALLFGLDSPAATDLTKGKADVGSLGRATLLGGTTKLGS